MTFKERMKKAMIDRNITQNELSNLTGVSKSGISQYLSGNNKPSERTVEKLAAALDVPAEWLKDESGEYTAKSAACANIPINLSIEKAAKLMGVGKNFIRVGLQNGVLPFGYAVKISGNRFTYFISPKKFTEYTGIEVESEVAAV